MQEFHKKWISLWLMIGWVMAGSAMASSAAPALRSIDASNRQAAGLPPSMVPAVPSPDGVALQHTRPAALQDWIAIDAGRLALMRGGFATEPGLKVWFGIERSVSINGELQSVSKFEFQDADARSGAAPNAGTVQLIQNGLGNTFQPGPLSQAAAATFIQNSLNHQTIQTHTVINASANSLDLLKSMNLQSALQDAMIQAVGAR